MTEQEIVRLLSTIKMKVKSTVADETWGKALQLIEQLQAENAALKKRLGKWTVDNEIVMEPRVKDGQTYYVISRKERRIVTHYICTELTPEAAEARLKELKGKDK